MRQVMSFALGLFFGALVGVALVLILTPQPGSEFQRAVRDRLKAVLEEARRAGTARRAEIAAQFSIVE